MMTEKNFETASGTIHYWMNDFVPFRKTLVFLPGLTADHHLFDRQIEAFEKEYRLLTWDAGHNSNTDKPEEVDQIIRDFVRSIQEESYE